MEKVFGRLIDTMVAKSRLTNWITIAITVFGLLALYYTKRDLHPPFEFNSLSVTVVLPEASPGEVERLVTYPIEERLLKIDGLEKITSKSEVGLARLYLRFYDEVKNLNEKVEEVRSQVQLVLRDLPSGISSVQVEKDSIERNQIFLANYSLIGLNESDPVHHESIAQLKRKLLAVNGVVKVETSLRPLQVYIQFDPKKLAAARVSPSLIRQAVRGQFDFQSISYYNSQGDEWLLELERTPLSVEMIRSIPLYQNAQEKKVTIGDVAKVEWRQPPLSSYEFLLNGQDSAELVLFKDTKSDSIALFEQVKKEIAKYQLPEGVSLKLLYDGPYFIQQQISVLTSNGFGGLILVLVMLALAMSWKTSLMTALGLPISYFGTFIILKFFGASIDLISLIAMILVVGNLVDDAVIMAERYTQLLEEGFAPEKAATTAAKELIVPVTGTILTIICAFVPMLFVEGNLSKIFAVIPVVIGAALLLSWIETFFILPNHLAHYVKKPPKMGSQKFFHHLSRIYRKALQHTLRFRYLYGVASLVLLGTTFYVASQMPQDFLLYVNSPQVEIYAEFPEGTTLDQSKKYLQPLHESLLTLPNSKIDFIEANLGWVWRQGKTYRGTKYASLRLVLPKDASDPGKLRDEVLELAKAKVEEIKKTTTPFVKLEAVANERGGANRITETVTVKVSGKDETTFPLAEREIIETLKNKGNIGDYIIPDNLAPLTYRFIPDYGRMTALQMSAQEASFQLQAMTSSVSLIKTRNKGEWTHIYLEPIGLKKPDATSLANIDFIHPQKQVLVPAAHVGTWTKSDPGAGISHEAGERILKVQFRFDSKSTNEQVVKREVEKLLEPLAKKYPQLQMGTEDSNEADQRGRQWIKKIIIIAAVLIFIILATVLRSLVLPFVVGMPIPFAMVGVIWALKAHNWPLGLMSMIGLIGTMGVAVNDSIVMVDQIRRLKEKFGVLTSEVIINGAVSRLRSITLTASCTLIGVFPTAYGLGGESGFTQPLAFSMGWGLLASLLLTLFIIPSMLKVLDDIQGFVGRLRKPSVLARATRKPLQREEPFREPEVSL